MEVSYWLNSWKMEVTNWLTMAENESSIILLAPHQIEAGVSHQVQWALALESIASVNLC